MLLEDYTFPKSHKVFDSDSPQHPHQIHVRLNEALAHRHVNWAYLYGRVRAVDKFYLPELLGRLGKK